MRRTNSKKSQKKRLLSFFYPFLFNIFVFKKHFANIFDYKWVDAFPGFNVGKALLCTRIQCIVIQACRACGATLTFHIQWVFVDNLQSPLGSHGAMYFARI